MKKTLLVVLALVLCTALVFTGCAKKAETTEEPSQDTSQDQETVTPDDEGTSEEPAATEDDEVVIGFANMADSIEFCMNVKIGLEEEVAKKGWKIVSLDNNLDGQKAVENTDALIQQEVDYVVMFNIDASTQPVISEKLIEAGIPAIAIDIYMPDFPFFGVNNKEAGELGGEYLGNYAKDVWGQEPDLYVILDNPMGGQYAKDRSDACEAGIRKVYPDFPADKIARIDAKADVMEAKAAMTDVLTAHPDAEYIVVTGINDQVCAGGLAALEAADRDANALVCSLGSDSSFLKQLQATKGEGAWKAAVSFGPELYGEALVPLIEKALAGEMLADENLMTHMVIDKDTVGEYYPDYAF